jgi:putative flippase GtrA
MSRAKIHNTRGKARILAPEDGPAAIDGWSRACALPPASEFAHHPAARAMKPDLVATSTSRRLLTIIVTAAQFGTVSVVAALVDVAIFSGLLALLPLPPTVINLFSFGCGVVTGFVLNRYWVFRRAGGAPSAQLAKFVAVNAASLVISTVAVGLMALVMPALAAKLLSLPITFCWNFAMSRSWVFKGKLQEAQIAD